MGRDGEPAVGDAQVALERLARQMAIGEVAAAIAHEINQPLGAIVNNANACLRLLASETSREEVREVMQNIVEDAQRASDIVEHIRALTRTGLFESTRFGVHELIHDVQRLAEQQLTDGKVLVEVRLAEGLPPLQGARIELQQLMLNLVLNAVDAMSGMPPERKRIAIDAQEATIDSSRAVEIRVTDAGIGFDPAVAERLFEPFYTSKRNGMGMGLRIGRSIAESHGGSLRALSTPGAGATFVLLLPVEDGP